METHVTRRVDDSGSSVGWHLHFDTAGVTDVWITGPEGDDDEKPTDQFRIEMATKQGRQSATLVLDRETLSRIAVDSNTILAR